MYKLDEQITYYPRWMVNEFIEKIFNFYNGKINRFNTARLHIEWANLYNSTIGGQTMNPDIVYIFPTVLMRQFTDPYFFWFNTLVSTIHELFHIDQDINFLQMSNPEYCRLIESAVEIETYLYIANHQIEIAQNIGFQDRTPPDIYYPSIASTFETGRLYKRRNYFSHCLNMIRQMMFITDNDITREFTSKFHDPQSIINIKINNCFFTLKDKMQCMPIQQLNDIMYNEFFKYTLQSSSIDLYNMDDNITLLEINPQCTNLMGKFIW